jgi:phage tail sheath protein FI
MATAGDGASKVSIEEEQPRIRQIQGVPTADLGMVAVTERGPVGVQTLCTSFEEWQRIYGNDLADGEGCNSARGFFLEGGQRLSTVRTVHYTDVDTPASKTSDIGTIDLETGATAPTAGSSLGANVGPWDLSPGDTLVLTIDGGAPATATFDAAAAARESAAENFVMTNGMILTVSINGGSVQSITFVTGNFVSIGAATAEEVAAVINAQIVGALATVTSGGTKVTITSDRKGTGSGVNVTGGTANAVLSFTTGNIAGTGDVVDIDAVTFTEAKTRIEADVAGCTVTSAGGAARISSNTTGGSSSVLVGASSTADDEFGFDNATHSGSAGASQDTLTVDGKSDGTYANSLQIRISDASSGDAEAFDLAVLDDGVVVETFTSLSMDETAERYVETVVNDDDTGSVRIFVTDLALVGTAAQKRPENATSGLLTGGNDGLSGLVDADFVGSAAGKTGMYGLDLFASLSMLIAPDRATSAVHNAMLSYVEIWRKGQAVALLDPPADQSATEIITYVSSTASLLGSSEYGAIFWPRIKVLNPSVAIYGSAKEIVIPPSGVVAGVIARGDTVTGGVYQPAAGVDGRGTMRSCLGFETDETLDEKKRDLVFPKRINPLTTGDGLPRHIDGFVTLKSNGNFPFLSERRGVIFIEQSIKAGLQFARWRNNDEALRAEVDRTVRLFLVGEMGKGAFRTRNPDTAFFVDFGPGLNPDSVAFAGQLKGRVGLATQKPAVFIIVAFSQDTRALEAELAAS